MVSCSMSNMNRKTNRSGNSNSKSRFTQNDRYDDGSTASNSNTNCGNTNIDYSIIILIVIVMLIVVILNPKPLNPKPCLIVRAFSKAWPFRAQE